MAQTTCIGCGAELPEGQVCTSPDCQEGRATIPPQANASFVPMRPVRKTFRDFKHPPREDIAMRAVKRIAEDLKSQDEAQRQPTVAALVRPLRPATDILSDSV